MPIKKINIKQDTINDLLKAKEDHYMGYLTDEKYIDTIDNILSYYVNAYNKTSIGDSVK